MLWTAKQRAALTVVIGALLFALMVRYWGNSAYVGDPQPEQGLRAGEVVDGVDPNTADWATLASLPRVGKSLAQRIIEERNSFLAAHPGQVPYTKLEDLLRVKGIGQATLRTLDPYLVFPPQDRPATRPWRTIP
ncbi:MAG: ComEA family DNA-binding protein [Bacillota bacterium]